MYVFICLFVCVCSTALKQATWTNLFLAIREHYGDGVADRLEPFCEQMQSTPHAEIDRAQSGLMKIISDLPVDPKHGVGCNQTSFPIPHTHFSTSNSPGLFATSPPTFPPTKTAATAPPPIPAAADNAFSEN
jgi:hypothetical protein